MPFNCPPTQQERQSGDSQRASKPGSGTEFGPSTIWMRGWSTRLRIQPPAEKTPASEGGVARNGPEAEILFADPQG